MLPVLSTETTRFVPLELSEVRALTSSLTGVPAPVVRLVTTPMSSPAASVALWPVMWVPLPLARMDPADETLTAPWLAPAVTLTSVRSPLLVASVTSLPALSALACTSVATVGPALLTDTAPPVATTEAKVTPALRLSSMKMPLPLLAFSVVALVCTDSEAVPTPPVPVRLTVPPVRLVLRLPSSCRVPPAPLLLRVSAPLPAFRLPAIRSALAVVLATVMAPPLDKALASSRSAEWVMLIAPPAEATDDSTEGLAAVR